MVDSIVRQGNSKLGKSIGKVALAAVDTCPGRGSCEKVCYAARLMRIYPSYNDMVVRQTKLLRENPEAYFGQIRADLKSNGYRTVRIHESGDFESIQQIAGWMEIVADFPNVQFFGYTRSWVVPSLIGHLNLLRDFPNVQIFASVETGESSPPMDWRTARIISKQESAPSGSIKCPEQTGKRASCADCGFCISANNSKTQNVLFVKH